MIYLDNGATTFPKPPNVTAAVSRAMREYSANPGRSGHKLSLRAASEVYACREAVAQFFNVENVENTIFTLNCTSAINTVLKGCLRGGDHVVVSSLEHNAVMRPLNELKRRGVSYTVANVNPYDDEDTIRQFRAAINDKTKLIVCMHCSNVWGFRLPVERLSALAHIYGIQILVDCAQSAGVFPIDFKESGIDYLCCAGHKGLYGPMGTGILIMSTPEKVSSLVQGGTGSSSLSFEQPNLPPDKFESGTVNLPGIAGLRAGIEFVQRKGIENISQREMALTQRLFDRLKDISGVVLYTNRPDAQRSAGMVSFNVSGVDSETTADFLSKNGIAARGGLHCAPLAHSFMGTEETGAVRLAPSVFTTRDEIDRTVNVIKKFVIDNKN